MYQSSKIVVVKSIAHYKNTGTYLHLTTTDYFAFYSDKPYYFGSISRSYNDQVKHNYNYQWCWLLNNTWANTYYRLNHNNQLETYITDAEEDSVGIWEAQYLQKYPYAMLYNTTYSKGFFSILLSANPHTASIGMLGTSASQFKEFQIHWSMDQAQSGDTFYASYISGVASTTSYVDELASSLYSSQVIQADSDNLLAVSSNPKIETDQRKNRIFSTTTPSLSFFHSNLIYLGHDQSEAERGVFLGDEDNVLNEWQLYYRYANATGESSLWLLAGTTINQSTYVLNSTYTSVTLQRDFETKFRIKLTEQKWSDSDSWYQTYTITALKSANVSYLWAYYRISELQASSSITELVADDTVKVNMSTYYVSGIQDNGLIFKKISGNLSRIETERYSGYSFLKFYFKYGSQQTFIAGSTWTLKLSLHPFLRFTTQGLGYYGTVDLHSPEEHQSEWLTYHHRLAWTKLLNSLGEPFRLNHYGKGYLIADSSAEADELNLLVAGTGTVNLYVGSKGKPESVEGASTSSYNESSQILTFSIASTWTIVSIMWSGEASGAYHLAVNVKRGGLPVAGAQISAGGQAKTSNLLGQALFELPYGFYTITATLG